MKKILVPCDFSKPAVSAFRFALDVAAKRGSGIHLINIIELPVLHDTVISPVMSYEQRMLDEFKEKAEASMKKIIGKYGNADIKITSEIQFGHVFITLQQAIADSGADLVVVGSHGARGAREFFIGSNAEKIVRNTPVPVMVVKDYVLSHMKHIVFPTDLQTEGHEKLMMEVKALQHLFDAQLHMVWINTPLNFHSDTITRKRLEAYAKRFMLKDYQVHIYNSTDEEEGILDFAKYIKADLIAMGTHARKGISHLLNGSLTEDVVNHASNVVWTYAMKHDMVEA